MEELLQYLKETKLKGLKGLRVEGEIPVSESQVNKLVDEFIRPQLKPGKKRPVAPGPQANPMAELLPFVEIPVLQVKLKKESVILQVKVKV